jgi:hypothetical protein
MHQNIVEEAIQFTEKRKMSRFLAVLGMLLVLFFLGNIILGKIFPSLQSENAVVGKNWQTLNEDGFSISYPSDWILDRSLQLTSPIFSPEDGLLFKSPDYTRINNVGLPTKGVVIAMLGDENFPEVNGLVSSEQITWLNQPATLKHFTYKGNYWVFTTTYKGTTYQFVANVANDEEWNTKKNTIDQIINSFKPK